MNDDIECPYCGKYNEIDHDDGYGYNENEIFSQTCSNCDKTFSYTTYVLFSYTAYKADCLNGGEHNYKQTHTFPVEFTKMRCKDCGHERELTEQEYKNMGIE